MNKAILTLLIALVGIGAAWAQGQQQNEYNALLNDVTTTSNYRVENRNGRVVERLLTNRALNHFTVKKVAYFLAGQNDLSLFNYSLSSNINNGTFSVKYGNSFRRRNSTNRIWNVYNIGFTSGAFQGAGDIFRKDRFQPNIGLDLKLSFLIPSFVRWGKKDSYDAVRRKTNMVNYRNQAFNSLIADTIANAYDHNTAAKRRKKVDEFYEKEADEADNLGVDAYSSFRVFWFSLSGYVPFTNAENFYIQDYANLSAIKVSTYNYRARLDFNGLLESTSLGSFHFIVGGTLMNTNEALAGIASKIKVSELVAQDTTYAGYVKYAALDADKTHKGEIKNRLLGGLHVRANYFFPFNKRFLGLSAEHNYYTDKNFPSDAKFGLLISAPADKDGKKRLNLEPQLVLNNLYCDLPEGKTLKNYMWFAVKVAIPFGSAIY